jgi:hypothetical protein
MLKAVTLGMRPTKRETIRDEQLEEVSEQS